LNKKTKKNSFGGVLEKKESKGRIELGPSLAITSSAEKEEEGKTIWKHSCLSECPCPFPEWRPPEILMPNGHSRRFFGGRENYKFTNFITNYRDRSIQIENQTCTARAIYMHSNI
jgi:hypothetical protein